MTSCHDRHRRPRHLRLRHHLALQRFRILSTLRLARLLLSAEALITIAADPKHLGARIGLTAVLHTWGSALTHHPHAHIIVPAGGFSPDGQHWIACRPGFFLSVRVLSRLFRRLFLERLTATYHAGRLKLLADQAALDEPAAFKAWLAAMRKLEWVVYAKRPFGGPDAVLAYLSRYTHRIAIANSRLVAFDGQRVTFKWKDYRAKPDARYKLMTLDADEFIRRFLIHVLPDGFGPDAAADVKRFDEQLVQVEGARASPGASTTTITYPCQGQIKLGRRRASVPTGAASYRPRRASDQGIKPSRVGDDPSTAGLSRSGRPDGRSSPHRRIAQ